MTVVSFYTSSRYESTHTHMHANAQESLCVQGNQQGSDFPITGWVCFVCGDYWGQWGAESRDTHGHTQTHIFGKGVSQVYSRGNWKDHQVLNVTHFHSDSHPTHQPTHTYSTNCSMPKHINRHTHTESGHLTSSLCGDISREIHVIHMQHQFRGYCQLNGSMCVCLCV